MIQNQWTFHEIVTEQDAIDMVHQFNQTEHLAGAFDSETTGLHIILDRPFLFQFGWLDTDHTGQVYITDLEYNENLSHRVIQAWHRLAATLPVYLAHNTKFDLHMLTNIGYPYTANNISDTMFYIRHAHDALKPEHGGPPLKLKPYASQYIDASAKEHEKLLDLEKTQITKTLNRQLKLRLKNLTPPEEYNTKTYTLKLIETIFKDPVFQLTDLPLDAQIAYTAWLEQDVPDWLPITSGLADSDNVPYHKLNRANVKRYAGYDIVWVLEIWQKLTPAIEARQTWAGIDIENQLIYPLLEMERVGFATDVQYLQQCAINMRNYMIQQRAQFIALAGEEVKLGQHARIKQILFDKFGQIAESTESDKLQLLKSELIRNEQSPTCVQFITLLEELRTLEKWYTTYIQRFLRDLTRTNRLYTTINQVGAVSGRVTSNFQQFPKDAIQTVDGVELFHPRKMIHTSGDEFQAIAYLDYSQIELRFQAIYTILVGKPDLNLCRAYMPYKCFTFQAEEKLFFDYTNPWCITHAYDQTWYLEETPMTVWTPTDVHGATTQAAFEISPDDPDFHRLRYIGKRVNFAKNYGAQYRKICQMFPEYDAARCRKIDQAYYTAFPGVKQYHEYCYRRAQYSYTENLFGIKYYGVSGHNLKNMLVQGSAAYYLKLKIIELYKYSKEKNINSRWQMQIHDELSWEISTLDDPNILFEFKAIMENWADAFVPLIAELEITKSSWAEKEAINNPYELQIYLSA